MNQRRNFIKKSVLAGSLGLIPEAYSLDFFKTTASKPKISLAQWSINRTIREKKLKAEDFADISKNTYGIEAIEFVSGLFPGKEKDAEFWKEMNRRSEDLGVTNLLIMIDDEGDLGSSSDFERQEAVENHFKWVDHAKTLNCHSIRVNAFGNGDATMVKDALVNGMGALAEYGSKSGINILIENHGLHSSNAPLIVDVIKQVNSPYLGTLPDFGNWCTSAKWGSTQGECDENYDHYKGVTEFLPYAKGVSAKSYNFDQDGNQINLDYSRFLKIVKDSNYQGYIGIEYEGMNLSEHEGILATKKLIERIWETLD